MSNREWILIEHEGTKYGIDINSRVFGLALGWVEYYGIQVYPSEGRYWCDYNNDDWGSHVFIDDNIKVLGDVELKRFYSGEEVFEWKSMY